MLRVGLVLAECYANACFAEEVVGSLGLGVKPRHGHGMGRDKVLKKAEKALQELKDDEYILIFIDYERGIARRYIDVNFELQTMYGGILHVGVFRRIQTLRGFSVKLRVGIVMRMR